MLVLAVLVAGCGSSAPGRSDDPWEQSWYLDHIETSGGVVRDKPTPIAMFVEFEPLFRGSDGCGQFQGSYEYDDPVLRFSSVEYLEGDPHSEAVTCPQEPIAVVEAMRQALRDGVLVTTMTTDTMIWQSGDTILEFHAGAEG
jgi:hypothetical protein